MKLAAIFLIFFAICGANARPPWYNGVYVKFQAATPFHYDYINPNLAHVVSWADIETIVDTWDAAGKQAGWDLIPFVMYLTEVDTEACVFDPLYPIGCILHTRILNNNGGALTTLNNAIRNDVVNEINNGNPRGTYYIKKLLNSAPANLRFGTGLFNRIILSWVDPMADINNLLTMKEKSMIYATDARCIHHNAFNFITRPFLAYAHYFRNVIGTNVNPNNIHLRGTYYDSHSAIRTTANLEFKPTNAANTIKFYVLSSSQAGTCQLGYFSGDQNNLGVTIRYYVLNI